jgi:hypothetical protein
MDRILTPRTWVQSSVHVRHGMRVFRACLHGWSVQAWADRVVPKWSGVTLLPRQPV